MRTQVVADYTFLYMRGAHLTQSMSENLKIARAETMCTFSLKFFAFAFYKFFP